MMNIMKSTGESSSRGREDGDGATGSERPLKKARFAWQVKGKYHLKNETDESNKNLTRPSTEFATSKPSSTTQVSSSVLTNKVENYLIKQDYSKLDSVINADNSLHATINNSKTEQRPYPRYISTYEGTSNNVLRHNCCQNSKTMSMTETAEDKCITDWQVKQIYQGFIDNSLNRILESWTNEPSTAHSRVLAQNLVQFVNHLPGDNSVENEGILMAISAHGLQNTPSSSSNDASYADNSSISSAHASDTASPPRCLSPVISDNSQITNLHCETEDKKPSEIQDWQTDNQNAEDSTHFAYFSEQSRSPYNFYQENQDSINQDSISDPLAIDSYFDFMNAAVSHAIKSKGMTASGTEYG